jgi:drug/metabolite transporter (DMT)-like permease
MGLRQGNARLEIRGWCAAPVSSNLDSGMTLWESRPVKAYIIITGALFGVIALLHLLRAIEERALLATHPGEYLFMAALGVLAGALSVWAWRILRLQLRPVDCSCRPGKT